jgi:hypothetical protein
MPNIRYQSGTAFERKTLDWLTGRGMAVVRAAGSKGAGKMDLVAFAPDGRVLIIQCKATGAISPAEWNRLVEIAGWIDDPLDEFSASHHPYPPSVCVPLVAMRGPRAKPGDGWSPRFCRLADVKVPRSRTWPWKLYDAEHGSDLGDAPGPGAGPGQPGA